MSPPSAAEAAVRGSITTREPTENDALLGSSSSSSTQSDTENGDALDDGDPTDPPKTQHVLDKPAPSSTTVLKIVLILLLGAFTANADSSLVMTTHPTIASEFGALSSSSWLFVSYSLAGAASQSIYGKLSDIYGRRPILILAYALFAAGCACVGLGRSMGEVILGRVVSGCGGSALNVLAMLIITDLVPLRQAASWQSGVNLAATTGRSLGGPVGGWLSDTVGWRWSFLGQVPVFMVAIFLCLAWLPSKTGVSPPAASPSHDPTHPNDAPTSHPLRSLARIDFLGALLLALAILALLLPIELGGSAIPWTHPAIPLLFAGGGILALLFVAVETRWAAEPVFPIELLRRRDVLLAYTVTGLQSAAQLGMMFSVPLYFQVTQRASDAAAGAHLFPAVAGNAVGAILAGAVIRRTGRYKNLLVAATALSSTSYLLLLLRWHGNTTFWESLYVAPGGFGTGIVQSTTFVAIQAAINPAHKAAATSGMFLVFAVGAMVGLASINAVTLDVMRSRLDEALAAMGHVEVVRRQIIEKAASSIDYLDRAEKDIAGAVLGAYIEGISAGHIVSLVCSALAIGSSMLLREHRL